MGACYEHQKPIQSESNPACSKCQRRSEIGCADAGGASVVLHEEPAPRSALGKRFGYDALRTSAHPVALTARAG